MKTHIYLILSLTLMLGCKKEPTPPVEFDGPTQINFVNDKGEKISDTGMYSPGERVVFTAQVASKEGLAFNKFTLEIVGIFQDDPLVATLSGIKKYEFPMDYPIQSIYAGQRIIFKYELTDNKGYKVYRNFVANIKSATLDYIGYFTPKQVDTVYNNAKNDYQYTFFSTYGAVFENMEIKQSINAGDTTLIDTKVPADVQNGAGASYKYWATYTPTFNTNTTNTVETMYIVKGVGNLQFTKSHKLVVIN